MPSTMVLLVIAGVFLILYLIRRRSRADKEE
jgi:hypothetical protein